MSEPVEKNKLISSSYEETAALFHNEELGMSIAPEDAIALTEASQAPIPSPDRYQSPLTGLDLETYVAVRQDEGGQAIQLRALIVEAGRGTTWAVDDLETFLTQSLGLKDSSELNICFDSCEANVADILLQLRQGDEVQRSEAAKSLLGIILGEPRDAGENLADLKRGLLVAAGHIAELSRSDIFYQEVAKLDGGKRQELWAMSHDSRLPPDPKLLLTLKEAQNKTPQTQKNLEEQTSDAPTQEWAGGALPVVQEAAASSAATSPVAPSAGQTLTWPNGGLTMIEQMIAQNLPRSSEQQRFLQSSGSTSLSERLTAIVQNPQLTPSQISQGLYYAILANGMSHQEFTSAQGHYAELRPVAAQIAGTIITRLGLGNEAKAYLKADYSAENFPTRKIQTAGSESIVAAHASPSTSGTSRSYSVSAARSLGIFADPSDSSAPLSGGALAASSAVAAGMMAIPFLSLVARTQQAQTGGRQDTRPSYFVEGTTAAQGEGRGGSGGQSSQGQQQDRRPSNPDQVVVA